VRRRDFAAGLLLAAAAERPALSQQPAKPRRIAVVAAALPASRITETEGGTPWRAFFEELRRLGYFEGRNIAIERHSPEGHPERQPGLALDVVSRSRVEDWRAGWGRSISTLPRFQPPPRRTQHADFPHCAPPFASRRGLLDLSCRGDFRSVASHSIAVEQP